MNNEQSIRCRKFREIIAKFGKTLLACADLRQLARVAGELPQRDRHGLGARLVEDRRLGFLISKSTTARREGDFVLAADFEFGAVKERVNLIYLEKMLRNKHFIAKSGFDTAENGPAQV